MTINKTSILIIDDEPEIRRFLKASLLSQNYIIKEAGNSAAAIKLINLQPPDLILLDLGLPDKDGIDLIIDIRSLTAVPIIVLSARKQEGDKVQALENGADDYLTKPFGIQELLARIKVALRHFSRFNKVDSSGIFKYQNIEINFEARMVKISNTEVHLSPIEYKLLIALVKNSGKVIIPIPIFIITYYIDNLVDFL